MSFCGEVNMHWSDCIICFTCACIQCCWPNFFFLIAIKYCKICLIAKDQICRSYLKEAVRCNAVTCSLCVAAFPFAPFLIRKVAENSSPCIIALCNKHWPSAMSGMSTSQPWPTRVLAMLSCCSVRAMCKGTWPQDGSTSFNLPGN